MLFLPPIDPEDSKPLMIIALGVYMIAGFYLMAEILYNLLASILPSHLVVPVFVITVALICVSIVVLMVYLIKRRIAKLRQADKDAQHD